MAGAPTKEEMELKVQKLVSRSSFSTPYEEGSQGLRGRGHGEEKQPGDLAGVV